MTMLMCGSNQHGPEHDRKISIQNNKFRTTAAFLGMESSPGICFRLSAGPLGGGGGERKNPSSSGGL